MRPMKGSGYVKESTGSSNELNSKLSDLIAQRDAQINAVFSDTSQTTYTQLEQVDAPIPKYMNIAIYSYVLDKYITEKAQRGLKYITPTQPDLNNMHEVVMTFLYAIKVTDIRYASQLRQTGDYIEYAQCATPKWGACAVHVFL
jgi:hypothetical protein